MKLGNVIVVIQWDYVSQEGWRSCSWQYFIDWISLYVSEVKNMRGTLTHSHTGSCRLDRLTHDRIPVFIQAHRSGRSSTLVSELSLALDI